MHATKSFTGRSRRRTTRRSVWAFDLLARSLITIGGIGTIVAVSAVCLFLAWVVVPLFWPARITPSHDFANVRSAAAPLKLALDEHQVLAWTLEADGTLRTLRLDRDEQLPAQRPLGDAVPTAASFPVGESSVSVGLGDGTVRLGNIRFETQFVEARDLPAELQSLGQLDPDETATHGGGVIQRIGEGQFRRQTLAARFDPPLDVDADSTAAVVGLDHVQRGSGMVFCVLSADGKLRIQSIVKRTNIATGKEKVTTRGGLLPLDHERLGLPWKVLLTGGGDNVFALWQDGRLIRYDIRNLDKPLVAEELDLVEDPRATLTAASFMLGRNTLIAGDSTGRMQAWFRALTAADESRTGFQPVESRSSTRQAGSLSYDRLVRAHEFPPAGSAVTSLTASTRTRILAAGFADGRVRLVHVTSEKAVGEVIGETTGVATALALAPKDDGLALLSTERLQRWRLDVPHPEVTLAALFLPVWYEGYDRPLHIWQSSAATQEFEPKLGLWPLVFGTIKATLYSMLFGAPLALLAALYTSEFLHGRIKSKIKPAIELMASLPSVVLGFLAALLFAPVIEKVVPVVLSSFVTVPGTFLLGAYLWQLLPYRFGLMLSKWRFVVIVLVLPLGLLAALALGPVVERLLFAGDLMAWLDGQRGSGLGGWMLLLVPLCSVGAFVLGREVNTRLRRAAANWSRTQCAVADLVKFFVGLFGAIGTAWLLSWLLTALGFDPRGSFVGTYDQRNALIVGFVMGFAIIPLIYTIAEDALSTVPQHLRSASLGAGATPWQTATRIVIPTAMSGLFSALMIGLGRAVGETMIVLMAAGNTPVRDWNIFNGFRTLSANIAVELPEAVADSTHYRTLFLAALCLFVLTFAVNTVAEIVRLRFRKRAYEL